MMSIEYIQALAEDRGLEAKALGLEPVVLNPDSITFTEDLKSIPNLGTYVPEGWEEITRYFVDSSGYGAPDEPALTFDEFRTTVRTVLAGKDLLDLNDRVYGWAIVEAGEFQIYVGLFKF